MSHANSGAALARTPRTTSRTWLDREVIASPARTDDRLSPSDLDLSRDARGVWAGVLEGVNVLQLFSVTPVYHRIARLFKTDTRCVLAITSELIIWFANRGIAEQRVRLLLVYLDGVVTMAYAGNAHADLDQLDLDEQDAENLENSLAMRRRVHQHAGVAISAEEYEDEAIANEREAAISITRARELRRQARLARAGGSR